MYMQHHAPAAPQSVERFFEFSLLGLLVSGFLAVVASGRLDLPTTILTALGLCLRGLLNSGMVRVRFSNAWINAATLAYIGFYPVDYAYLSREFMSATVHMIFFLAVLRVLTASTDRDYFFVKAVAFLELLAASVLSNSLSFFVFLVFFLLFGVATFTSSEIRRSAQASNRAVRGSLHNFHWRLAGLTISAGIGILIMTAGMFFLLPRTARAAFRQLISQRYHLPGFSNEVTLGQLGEIKQSTTPIMHIRIEDQTLPMQLKWRGAALSSFDGQRWFNAPSLGEPLHTTNRLVRLAESKQQWRRGTRISYEVRIQALDSDALFFTGVPEFARLDLKLILRNPHDSYRTGLGTSDGLHYFGISQLDADNVAASYAADPLPVASQTLYTALPEIDPRISRLSRELTRDARNDVERGRLIEKYLRTNFGYTTQLLAEPVADPLAYFLFDRRKGHCEYFASAMAVMLRTLHIPSRLVTGFQSGVYNPMSDWYVIRAADAHSWVEAYIPNHGWVTFDPTPPDPNAQHASVWSHLNLYLDAAETFWQDWVLNYSLERQLNLAARVDQSSRASVSWLEYWNTRSRHAFAEGLDEMKRWAKWIVILLTTVALLAAFGRPLLEMIRSALRMRRLQKGTVCSSDAALLYLRMLAILRRRGYEKPAWLTPAEFARVLPASPTAEVVHRLTSAYNELRFGGRSEAGVRMIELLRELETAPR